MSEAVMPEGAARLQVALPRARLDAMARLLDAAAIGFVSIDPATLFVEGGHAPLAPLPLLLRIHDGVIDGTGVAMRAGLQVLSNTVPIIAIVDLEALDEATSILDMDAVQLAIWPRDGEEMTSILMHTGFNKGVAENVEDDGGRMRLSQLSLLSDEVSRIAERLATLAKIGDPGTAAAQSAGRSDASRARIVRDIIRRRRARSQFFPAELFADPAWDILLDLAAARLEGKRVSISSLCIAADVPTTTALRWIKGMTEAGILVRHDDPDDGRRSFVDLADATARAMDGYLDMVEGGG
jgi:hypothetical protein